MQLPSAAIFVFAIIAIAIIVFIVTYVLRKNRRDLQKLEAELKQDEDNEIE